MMYRVVYLSGGMGLPHGPVRVEREFSLDDATRHARSLIRRARTAWVEDSGGNFVPIAGAKSHALRKMVKRMRERL